jgi:hypothetical protein
MRIQSAKVEPQTTTTGNTVAVEVKVTSDQGFLTSNQLLLKTKDGTYVIVKDTQ